MENTIIGFQTETQKARDLMKEVLVGYKESLKGIDTILIEIEKEFMTAAESDKYELRKYKSMVLQMKSDLINQSSDTEKVLGILDKTLELYHKVIQLKTGDIF